MNKNDLEKIKLQTEKTRSKLLHNYLVKIYTRNDNTLRQYPDSRLARENKSDCEEAFNAEKKLLNRAQLEATQLPRGQVTIEDIE